MLHTAVFHFSTLHVLMNVKRLKQYETGGTHVFNTGENK